MCTSTAWPRTAGAEGQIAVGPDRTRHPRRRFLQGSLALGGLSLCAGCGAVPSPRQQASKVPQIRYLALKDTGAAEIEAFRGGLRELGYLDGQTIAIEVRLAEST